MKKYIALSVVSLVVGLIALVSSLGHSAPVVTDPSAGGTYNVSNVGPTFTTGADYGTLPVTLNWDGGKIGARSNIGFWRNTTGQVAYVTYAEISTDNFASSSYKIFAYSTTTAPRTVFDFAAPVQTASTTMLINGFALATSSNATTTSSDDSKSGGPQAGGTAQVPVNGYFIFQMISTAGTACASSGGLCESATSTRRGFNLQWRIEYHN